MTFWPQFALPGHEQEVMQMTAPAAPTITGIAFDQPSYSTGQKITATVNYTAGTSDTTQTLTGVASDSATGQTGQLVVNFILLVSDTTTIQVSDSAGRIWTKVSDSGTQAVFTATA